MSKQTNVKPKEWYEEYYKNVIGYPDDEVEGDIESAIETDKMMDYMRIIYEKGQKGELETEAYSYNKAGERVLLSDLKPEDRGSIATFVRFKSLEGIPEEARDLYHSYRIADEYFQLKTEWNTIEDNKRYLDRLKKVANLLKEYCDINFTLNLIKITSKALEQGYLITHELSWMFDDTKHTIWLILKDYMEDIDDWDSLFPYIHCEGYKGRGFIVSKDGGMTKEGYIETPSFNFESLKVNLRKYLKPLFNFEISEERLFSVIKKEVKWYNKERDIEIFKERKKGRLLEDLAEEYHINESTVSIIAKKVQGAVNYYKGKIFEKEYHKYLKNLNKYDKVILEGASGKADIYAYDEENDTFHIFSLKYYEIKKRPYHIKVKEFKSELKLAYDNQFDYKDVKVYLIVFDLLSNTKEEKELDFRNPKEIVLD